MRLSWALQNQQTGNSRLSDLSQTNADTVTSFRRILFLVHSTTALPHDLNYMYSHCHEPCSCPESVTRVDFHHAWNLEICQSSGERIIECACPAAWRRKKSHGQRRSMEVLAEKPKESDTVAGLLQNKIWSHPTRACLKTASPHFRQDRCRWENWSSPWNTETSRGPSAAALRTWGITEDDEVG